MATGVHILPTIPRYVFAYFEPVSLVAGALAPIVDPTYFVAGQLAHLKPHTLYPTEYVLALQLGNLYLLSCLVGLFILNTTTEVKVVRRYILALWIADIGHVGATGWVMGWQHFADITGWNALTMGNVGVTVGLFAVRSLYLLGFLGEDHVGGKNKEKNKTT